MSAYILPAVIILVIAVVLVGLPLAVLWIIKPSSPAVAGGTTHALAWVPKACAWLWKWLWKALGFAIGVAALWGVIALIHNSQRQDQLADKRATELEITRKANPLNHVWYGHHGKQGEGPVWFHDMVRLADSDKGVSFKWGNGRYIASAKVGDPNGGTWGTQGGKQWPFWVLKDNVKGAYVEIRFVNDDEPHNVIEMVVQQTELLHD